MCARLGTRCYFRAQAARENHLAGGSRQGLVRRHFWPGSQSPHRLVRILPNLAPPPVAQPAPGTSTTRTEFRQTHTRRRHESSPPHLGPGGTTVAAGEVLWELAQKWELQLVTPRGEPTRVRHGHRDSTIDHIWASSGLTVGYEGDADLEGSDHRAQAAKISTAKLEKGPPPRGWAWAMMVRSIVPAEASTITVPSGLTTTEELDAAADRLIAELSTIADHSTPRRRQGSGEGVAW